MWVLNQGEENYLSENKHEKFCVEWEEKCVFEKVGRKKKREEKQKKNDKEINTPLQTIFSVPAYWTEMTRK